MRKFLLGWVAATLFAAGLKTIFDMLLWALVFTTAVHQPPVASDLPSAALAFVASLAVYWIDFLVAFAVAFFVARRFPSARLCIFAVAGVLALIVPTIVFVGPQFLVLLWQNTLAEIAIGAVAGVVCGWISRSAETVPMTA